MPKFVEFDQASMYDPAKNSITVNVTKIMSFSPSEFFDPTYGKRECTIINLEGKNTIHVTNPYAEVKKMIDYD